MALEREDRDAIVEAIQAGFASAARAQSQQRQSSGGGSGGGGSSFGRGRAEFEGALGDITGIVNRAGGSVQDFTKDITSLASRIPAIGGLADMFGSSVGSVIGYLEITNSTFQALSKVGAGFNGDLGALRAAAANTRMPLDQFADLVGRNAQALAGLGAGVNGGAQRFAELSRAMFEDGQTIQGLTNLGYTLAEANELLLDNTAMMRRGMRLTGMDEKQVAAATLKMAENMAFIAEVTGESAEQQRQEMLDAQRDGKNIAAMRLAEAQGASDVQQAFNSAFQGLNVVGDQGQALLQDYLQVGAPVSATTQAFEAQQPAIAATIREMAQLAKTSNDLISPQEKQARMAELNARIQQQVAASQNDTAALTAATYGQFSDVGAVMADFYGNTENYNNAVAEMQAQMGAGTSLAEAARELERQTMDRIAAQRTGTGTPGQQVSAALNQATIDLANGANRVHMAIARNLGANTQLADTARAAFEGLGTIAQGQGSALAAATEMVIPGSPDDTALQAENEFASLFQPLVVNNALLTRIQNFEEMEGFFRNLAEIENNPELERLINQIFGGGRASGGPISAGRIYRVGEQGPETIIPGFDGTVIPNMENALDTTASTFRSAASAMQPQMQNMAQSLQSILSSQGPELGRIAESMSTEMRNMFDTQSNSILPNIRNTIQRAQEDPTMMQGLQNAMETFRAEVSRSGPEISTNKMEQLLDTLNQSMLQLIQINNNVARNSARQADAIRGAGNLMQGVSVR